MPRPSRLLHFVALVVILLCASLASVADEPAASTTPTTWYAQALTRGDAGLNVTHFWSKGPKLRAETVVAGHKVVTIVSGSTYYAYDDLSAEGIAIRRDQSAIERDRDDRRPFGNEYERLLDLGAELVREEILMGRATGVFRLTDDFGKRELFATLDDLHLPLRIEIYKRASSQRTTTDYLNWQSGLAIDDGFFVPDARAKLESMDYPTYATRTATEGPIGPVPVLYNTLLSFKD